MMAKKPYMKNIVHGHKKENEMIVKQNRINGDYEYMVSKKLNWNPKYEMFNGELYVSDTEFIGQGRYRANAYHVDDQKEIQVEFYIPEHNPANEPADWEVFWYNNPEPETAEEWEKYII